MSWIEDEVDDPDGDADKPLGAGERSGLADGESFEKQLRAIVAAGNSTVSLSLLEKNIGEVNDVELLEQVRDHVDTEEKRELVVERLDELGDSTDTDDDEADQEATDGPEDDADEEAESEDDSDEEDGVDTGRFVDIDDADEFDRQVRNGVLDGTLEHIRASTLKEYVGTLDGEVVEKVHEKNGLITRSTVETAFAEEYEDRQSDDDETDEEADDSSETSGEVEEESETGDEDLDDVFDGAVDDADDGSEPDESETTEDTDPFGGSSDSGAETADAESDGEGDWTSAFDDAAADSGGITVSEAAEMENRWTMLVWSEPGMGKTHFGFSAKEPVVIIDTEGKAHNLADRFTDKKVKIYQPTDYDEALDALHDGLDLLENVMERTGRVGTLVVDSMSIMWEWSQQKYVDKFYQGKDIDEVNFSSAMGSGGKSDWKQIKRYHNTRFRQPIIDSPFHFVWTAMATEAYDVAIEEGLDWTPMKPSGEKNNEYKSSEVLRLRENQRGETVGELEKTDKVGHKYTGLSKPTFPKHQKVVDAIKTAERGERSLDSVEREFNVEVFEGNPRTARIHDED